MTSPRHIDSQLLHQTDDEARRVFLADFLRSELTSEDARQELLAFINNWSIRTGEYECNIYVVHKLDRRNFLIYADEQWGEPDEQEMRQRCVYRAFGISRDMLADAIETYQIEG